MLRPYNLRDAGRNDVILLISSDGISSVTSFSLAKVTMHLGTVGMIAGSQLEAGSSLALKQKSLAAALRSSSCASTVHRLNTNLTRTGLINPMETGEIEFFHYYLMYTSE